MELAERRSCGVEGLLRENVEKLVHRRDLHKYVRYEDVAIHELLRLENDERIKNITSIISHNPMSKEYKAQFADGSVDYIIN